MKHKSFFLGKREEYFVSIHDEGREYLTHVSGPVGTNKRYAVNQIVSKMQFKVPIGRILLYVLRESLDIIKKEQKKYNENLPFTSRYKR